MAVVYFFILLFSGIVLGRILHVNNSQVKPSSTIDSTLPTGSSVDSSMIKNDVVRPNNCPGNLEWFECSYNISCQEFELNSLETNLRNCTPGCFCPKHYYQYKDECIGYPDCPIAKPATRKCTSPLEWDDCYFNISCSEYGITSSEYERKTCQPGCFCPKNHYVHDHKCYFYSECPDECSRGKRWNECGNFCEELCPVIRPPDNCRSAPKCSSGCFCKNGKRSFAGHCLKLENCPSNIPKTVFSEINSNFAYMEL